MKMENEFIPYEQALALKELGFDEPCLGWYLPEIVDKGNVASVILGSYITKWNKFGDRLSVPTFSQAFRWFRNKYGYLHHITYFDPYKAQTPGNADYQGYVLFPHAGIHKLPKMSYDTYEEAELACFIKLIEIIKTK